MLIHIFVDRIYLYDDHLVIYLKGTDKRITISDHEAGIVEESLTDKGSENEECGPPEKRQPLWLSFFILNSFLTPQIPICPFCLFCRFPHYPCH